MLIDWVQELVTIANPAITAEIPEQDLWAAVEKAYEVAGVNEWQKNGKEFFDVHSDALAVTPHVSLVLIIIHQTNTDRQNCHIMFSCCCYPTSTVNLHLPSHLLNLMPCHQN